MESDEFQAKLASQRRGGFDVMQVLFPGEVRSDAARNAYGVEAGVILADTAEHPGNDLNPLLLEECNGLPPDIGCFAQRVQRKLHPEDVGFLELSDEIPGCGGLQRPTTDRESGNRTILIHTLKWLSLPGLLLQVQLQPRINLEARIILKRRKAQRKAGAALAIRTGVMDPLPFQRLEENLNVCYRKATTFMVKLGC